MAECERKPLENHRRIDPQPWNVLSWRDRRSGEMHFRHAIAND
jgi:hypothetical protein